MDLTADPRLRSRTARASVGVAGSLVLLKLATWWYTGSTGLLGSALDSSFDLLASLLILWAVRAAERPPDADHPWGHGKAEGLASLFQGVFVLFAGLAFAAHTLERFFRPETRSELTGEWAGIVVMVVASAATVWLIERQRRTVQATGSPAIRADRAHYASDLGMNAAVALGLGLSWLLGGNPWPDLVVGLGVALIILNTARNVLVEAFSILMDAGLSPCDSRAILTAVRGCSERVRGFHELRSRRSGTDVFLELHLDLDRDLSFVEAHDLAESVQAAIQEAVPRSRVTVHTDPL